MKQSRNNPETIHQPVAHYVHQIEITNPQQVLVLSGQIGMDVHQQIPDDAALQLKLALQNIQANLTAAAMDIADITKMTIYVTEPIEAAVRGTILTTFFGDHTPCMTYLQIQALASPALKVEIDVIVYK